MWPMATCGIVMLENGMAKRVKRGSPTRDICVPTYRDTNISC